MPRYKIVDLAFLTLLALMMMVELLVDLHWAMYAGVIAAYLAMVTLGAFFLSWQYFVPVRWKAAAGSDAIAISFDDGPMAGDTHIVLDILARHQVPAAFFCIGSRIEGNEALLRRIDDAGHLVGNHSFFHGTTFDLMSTRRVMTELENTEQRVAEVIGKKTQLFRPPYGVTNPMIAAAVDRLNYTVVGWSVRSFDTITKDPTRLLKRVTDGLKGGDIVLFHDHCASTHQILETFIIMARQKGLRIIRLDELLNEKPYR